ncbi:Protein of unknown function [Pyronema omphalodes CBS 100304]|uniref:Uncharacterized protein n=1 Tax=Pyronema omphalodes (strain CBS 100304) TaxID=1076935 RepID=U4KW45_PYROM|nr:Protein of unknown function [Pyronema omphalodes CBS 100304]
MVVLSCNCGNSAVTAFR